MNELTFYTLLSVYFLVILLHGYLKIYYTINMYDYGNAISKRFMLLPTLILMKTKNSNGIDWEIVFALFRKRWYICYHSFKNKPQTKQ